MAHYLREISPIPHILFSFAKEQEKKDTSRCKEAFVVSHTKEFYQRGVALIVMAPFYKSQEVLFSRIHRILSQKALMHSPDLQSLVQLHILGFHRMEL